MAASKKQIGVVYTKKESLNPENEIQASQNQGRHID